MVTLTAITRSINISTRTLGTIETEGFTAVISQEDDGQVHFLADADGANGQNGGAATYCMDDTGTDFLANAGMRIRPDGKVTCAHAGGW